MQDTGGYEACYRSKVDDSEKLYDLEIQRSDLGADPHHTKYHSSVIDVENFDASQGVKKLLNTYIIFITESDFTEKDR